VYYFNENITIDSFDYNTLAGSQQDGYARQQQFNISTAAFGSLGYQITDQFKLKGGVRFTQDDKELRRPALRVAVRRAAGRPDLRRPELRSHELGFVRRMVRVADDRPVRARCDRLPRTGDPGPPAVRRHRLGRQGRDGHVR
jgi:hypothetical protein